LTTNDHTIDVKVRADTTGLSKGLSDAEQGLQKAGAGFSKYGTDAEKAAAQSQGFAEKNKASLQTVGKDAMIMGGALLAGVGLAVAAFSDFAGRMAQVQSLSHASSGEMDVLTKSALTMGTSFGLSANDVADAEIEMVKAGISVKDMLSGGLSGALTLAAAGQIDVGKATEIATIAMTQFGLAGKDIPHVADLLTAGADKALGGVADLGEALKSGGLVAHQFGVSLDETVGTLSLFAQNGLMGEAAGTDLRQMLLKLAAPSKTASEDMAKLGMSIYDTKGHFVGMRDLAGQLKDKMQGLSEAERNAMLAHIFGARSIVGANILYQAGAKGVTDWTNAVNDSGFAAKQAAGKMDSLNGDFKKLQASFQTGLIEMGAASDGFLRPVVQGITRTITAFNSMDPAGKGLVMTIAAITGGGALLVGGLLTLIPKVYDSVKAVQALRTAASPAMASALGGVGKAAALAAVGVAALTAAAAVGNSLMPVAKSAEETTQALLKMKSFGTQSVNDLFKSFDGGYNVAKGINGVGDAIFRMNNMNFDEGVNKWFNDVAHIPDSLKPAREQIEKIDGSLANFANSGSFEIAANGFKHVADEAEKQGVKTEVTAKSFPQYMDSLRKLASDMKVSLDQQELLNWALGKVPQKMLDAQNSTEGQAKMAEVAAQKTKEQQKALDDMGIAADGLILHLDKLIGSMQAAGLVSISADQAAINYQKSLEAVDAMVAKNGKTLDIHTAAGKENMEAWLGQASAADAATLANAKNGVSSADLQVTLTGQYTQLRDNAIAFGKSGDEADAMARKALGIPKDVKIETAIQNYADTMAKAQAIKAAVDGIQGKSIDVVINHINNQVKGGGYADDPSMTALTPGRADGGDLDAAPGPKGVDSRLFYGAKGEHVLTDSDVDAMGGQAAVYAFRKQLHDGGVRPLYAAAAPSNAWAPVATQQSRGGGVNANFTINQVDDPIGTSHAVVRRLSALAS
jgi:TP901 family phage tail tape measure protein